jgi:GNAT superfamily N-acetyltransferase
MMDLTIRPIQEGELPAALAVLRHLRPHLTPELFGERLARQQRQHGYEMLGAFAPELAAVLGMRVVETMARGPHLHVDDLVVVESLRGSGVGRQLLTHAEDLARQRGLRTVFLDSRPEALGFYQKQGYALHTAPLVVKVVQS